MIFLEASIYIKSDKSLEEVGQVLSKKLFGGLPFGGKENFIRDEIPTIYIEPEIIGLEIILIGDDKDGTYCLEINPSDHPVDYNNEETDNLSKVNFSNYLKFLLRNVEDLTIMSDEEIEEFEATFDT